MKSNTLLVLVIVLVILNIMAINAWPFGFRGSLQGFKTQRVGKEGYQSLPPITAPSVPIMTMPQRPPGSTSMPSMTMPSPPMPSTTMPSMTMPSMTMPSTTMPSPPMPSPPMPSPPMPSTMPSQTSNPVTAPTVPMLPIRSPNTPAMMDASGNIRQGFRNASEMQGAEFKRKEGFQSRYLDNAGGAKDLYQPMGAFDGVNLPTGNKSPWRYTSPNEALLGAEFTPGDDSLFIFKNNQCKPECCGASFSCSGGCVCTTENQRDYINGRGGNRTSPAED